MGAADTRKQLEDLLCQIVRQPTAVERAYDPGAPITREQASEAVAGLSNRQVETIDCASLLALKSSLADVAQEWKSFTHFDGIAQSAPLRAARKLDPASRAATYITWAIAYAAMVKGFPNFIHLVRPNRVVSDWLRSAMLVLERLKQTFSLPQFHALCDCHRDALDRSEVRWPFAVEMLEVAVDGLSGTLDVLTLDDADITDLRRIRSVLAAGWQDSESRRRLAWLDEVLQDGELSPLWNAEPWAAAITQSLASMPPNIQRPWSKVLAVAGSCNSTRPSKPWLKETAAIVAALPEETFAPQLETWLRTYVKHPQGAQRPTADPRDPAAWQSWAQDYRNRATNLAHLIGLISLTLVAPSSARFASLLADIAERVSRAPRDSRDIQMPVAAAAVRVLSAGSDDESLAQLSRLEMRVRWPKLKKLVRKELDQIIKRKGLDRADVEESLVPDFSLRDGTAALAFEGATAHLALGLPDKPSVTWKLSDGKSARTLPSKLKAANPSAAEEVKQTVTDIERMRAAQRTRLDLLMRRPRTWPIALWRQRYLDHGLVGTLARRLIWLIDDIPAIWREAALVDIDGKPIAPGDNATVQMWHPARRSVDEVVAWRTAIETWQIAQPFKQAYREIYLLTDAERRTATYSNRFAAHIVRSMTLLSISQVRQWKSGLYGGASSPSFELIDYGLRAEWWLQPAGDNTTPYGAPVYLASDQVRFVCTSDESARRFEHSGTTDPLPLDRVPPLALSEILRDVDLFVALASVGNDPNWSDGGPGGHFRDYWHQYSFGDLNESAKTRKAALDHLIPRLAIRDRCRVADKFLYVKGDLRTYKIHLGSGNILMEPNDQYLCIVPNASARQGDSVFLPFEGDATLSVILSKAFLLAADTKITDPTITRQIGPRGGVP